MTLIELLVVMALIAVLAGIGVSAFQTGGGNAAVSTAAAEVTSAVEGARQLAISSNHRVRFIIVTGGGGNPTEWQLSRFGVMKEERQVSGSEDVFKMVTPLKSLRSGVYFREDDGDLPAGMSSSGMFDDNTDDATVQGKRVEYAFIEFLPTGGTSGGSGQNIFKIVRAPDARTDYPDNYNYARVGVAQHTGRVKVERPEVKN